ncbi:peptidoglycan-binding protein [Devosia sp. SL43]|uniref:peptidoglycan-binding protein n=1 Tax=Devosia sp. SL43 TaxID=2806348 RepID=UPI001F3766A1|nr:peptidoglycan-binding protein [Devosia sp. SL43]UJW85061.1 SEL1-like repeat protein [Devosia sp. SL43]
MARAYSIQDMSDPASEPQPGEWQALRGELVALLDQVEGRYARVEQPEPALSGLAQRVRNLRDQVVGPEPSVRRREALRTVKRAVDRFSERDELGHAEEPDALTSAIAEIRGRQMSGTSAAALGRRVGDIPEFRELNSLVGGLSGRLERLEGELKAQRNNNGSVREVASQVEQLTHVVELLAGAVGETGQVKRLESQIAALGALIEEGPKVDLSAINKRLDDVSGTVGKLAELQAQQMEREIAREDRKAAEPKVEGAGTLMPAMHAIEKSVRNVYDRIDSIEKNVALSSGDFERLTSEMASFTQAMKDREAAPSKLVAKVDALAARIGDFETSNGDVVGLKQDISGLRDAVLAGMEPRFTRMESQIEALSERMSAPVAAADTSEVENQLKLLMQRMDETGAQLNGLAKLYSTPSDTTDMEAMATLVAERTSDAVTRKAPAPVAMFGPDSLKSIEDRLTGLIKTAGKTPDYEALAAMVAEKTSEAVARSTPSVASSGISEESLTALEERMSALLNVSGKDTAERLARLEAALSARSERPAQVSAPISAPMQPARQAPPAAAPEEAPVESRGERLEAMLAALGSGPSREDAMPANPADDAPLLDPGFKDAGPVRTALDAKAALRPPVAAEPVVAARPHFDPASVERPPQPQSSFARTDLDPFAPVVPTAAPSVDAPVATNSTSTFVAAARRAQRARSEAPAPAASSNSAIGRALSRFMPDKSAKPAEAAAVEPVVAPPKAEKPAKPVKEKKVKAAAAEAPSMATSAAAIDAAADKPSFLTRYRRPLLLAATLVAVSMLALNLVMQRMAPARAPQPAPAVEAPAETPSAEPTASQDVSLVKPEPRIIDMVDNIATASIPATGFARNAVATTAMPPSIMANSGNGPQITPADVADDAPLETASIASADGAQPQTFELPVEGVGPIELRQAAADGDARAQFEIAAIFTEGRAVEQNYPEAAIWYERSAAQGFVPAQYRLGNLYETGTGVEKDLEVAKLWYQRGAEAGNRMAMHNLAALYAGGQLGEQQFETAAEWFTKAANLGMTDSQFNLGMLYARGLGVSQDFEQSYKWFSLAAQRGDADAGKARDDIAKSLTADAVSRVNEEVTTWVAQPIDLASNFAPIGTWSASFQPGEAITTSDVVTKVQQALARLGFDVGTPDGVAGPKTAEAVKAFERGTGMNEIGTINPRLLAVLGSQPV